MGTFSASTLRQPQQRFRSPARVWVHHIEVLYPDGSVDYFDEHGDLSPNREDCREFDSDDIKTAEVVYLLLCGQGFDASIETSERVFN